MGGLDHAAPHWLLVHMSGPAGGQARVYLSKGEDPRMQREGLLIWRMRRAFREGHPDKTFYCERESGFIGSSWRPGVPCCAACKGRCAGGPVEHTGCARKRHRQGQRRLQNMRVRRSRASKWPHTWGLSKGSFTYRPLGGGGGGRCLGHLRLGATRAAVLASEEMQLPAVCLLLVGAATRARRGARAMAERRSSIAPSAYSVS